MSNSLHLANDVAGANTAKVWSLQPGFIHPFSSGSGWRYFPRQQRESKWTWYDV